MSLHGTLSATKAERDGIADDLQQRTEPGEGPDEAKSPSGYIPITFQRTEQLNERFQYAFPEVECR